SIRRLGSEIDQSPAGRATHSSATPSRAGISGPPCQWHSSTMAHTSAQSDPVSGILPDIQLAFSDPLAWEERWERIFATVDGQPVFSLSRAEWSVQKFATSMFMQDPNHQDAMIRCARNMRNTLCDIQAEMTGFAAPFLLGNNLQQRWMSASPAKRGEIILAGLVAACTCTPGLHMARWYCEKELRVASHRRDGRLFLNLLEEMMVQNGPNVGSPATPTYISHPVWDAIVAHQRQASNATTCEKITLQSLLADRNMLIGFVIHFALCSILDMPSLPGLHQRKYSSKPEKPKSNEIQDIIRAACGKERSEAFGKAMHQTGKRVYAQYREVHAGGKQFCQTCKRPNDTTTKYPRCRRCWDKMQREVLYCSSECQKIDWKAGHKKECGRSLRLEDLNL
ncbi:hypothetical protein FB45DRAFT_1148774, partial [Roridomyces roridus]